MANSVNVEECYPLTRNPCSLLIYKLREPVLCYSVCFPLIRPSTTGDGFPGLSCLLFSTYFCEVKKASPCSQTSEEMAVTAVLVPRDSVPGVACEIETSLLVISESSCWFYFSFLIAKQKMLFSFGWKPCHPFQLCPVCSHSSSCQDRSATRMSLPGGCKHL